MCVCVRVCACVCVRPALQLSPPEDGAQRGSEVLREVDLPQLDDALCRRIYPFQMPPKTICAGHLAGGKDTCQVSAVGQVLSQVLCSLCLFFSLISVSLSVSLFSPSVSITLPSLSVSLLCERVCTCVCLLSISPLFLSLSSPLSFSLCLSISLPLPSLSPSPSISPPLHLYLTEACCVAGGFRRSAHVQGALYDRLPHLGSHRHRLLRRPVSQDCKSGLEPRPHL